MDLRLMCNHKNLYGLLSWEIELNNENIYKIKKELEEKNESLYYFILDISKLTDEEKNEYYFIKD